MAEALVQYRGQTAVLLNSNDLSGALEQDLRKWPQPGADLQHLVLFGEIGKIHYSLKLIGVVKKVLTERLGELNAFGGQQLAHFGKLHSVRSTSERCSTALSSSCRVMVRGG